MSYYVPSLCVVCVYMHFNSHVFLNTQYLFSSQDEGVYMCVCVCVCACVRACVRVFILYMVCVSFQYCVSGHKC